MHPENKRKNINTLRILSGTHFELFILVNNELIRYDLAQFDNVLVFVELPQDFNLAHGGKGKALLFLLLADLLQRHNLIRPFISRLEHLPKCALANYIAQLVLFDA